MLKMPPTFSLAHTLHVPPNGAARAAVIFLQPLLEERKAALPAIALAAELLAREAECVTLIFDYRGTGASDGEFENFALEDWREDLRGAIDFLKNSFPALPIATLAVRTAAVICPSAELFWDPIDGKEALTQWLRRKMVNEMITYGAPQLSREELLAALGRGETIDLDGYPFTARHFESFASMPFEPPTSSLLLTARALKLPPYWNTIGRVDTTPLIRATLEWARKNLRGEMKSFANPELPAAEKKSAAKVLMLPGWAGDFCGPHRLFVQARRDLFAADFSEVCAVNYRGRGAHAPTFQATIATMLEDARAELSPKTDTLIAICSGCKVALNLAAENPHLERLVLWSPEIMGGATGARRAHTLLSRLKDYGKKIFRAETWKKLLRGKLHTKTIAKSIAFHEMPSAEELKTERAALRRFRQTFRGRALVIFGASDPNTPAALKFYKSLLPAADFHVLPNAGHSFYSLASTAQLLALTKNFLAAENCERE